MQRPSVFERDEQNGEIQRRSTQLHSSSSIPHQPGTDQRQIQEQSFLSEIMRIPPTLVAQLKQELGLDGKELTAMTFDDKRRLVEAYRQWTKANLSSPSSNPAMTSNEKLRTSLSSNPAPPDISEPPFTFEFIRSVTSTMAKFDPSPSTHLPPPVKCCPICGALNHNCLGHWPGPQFNSAPPGPNNRTQKSMVMLPLPSPGMNNKDNSSSNGPQQQGQPQQMMNNIIRQPMGGPQMNGGFQPGIPQLGTNPMTMLMSQMSGGPMGSMSPAMSALPGQTMMNAHMQPIPNMPNRDRQNPYRTQMQHQMHNRGMPGNTGSPA